MRRIFSWCAALSLIPLTGCGGGSGNSSSGGNRISSVTITPTSAIVRPNGTRAFVFQIQGTGTPDTSVVWSTDSGTIDNNGVFVANGTQSTAHVTVKSVFDPTKTASADVTVSSTAGPTFSIDSSTTTTLARRFFAVDASTRFDLGALIKVSGAANTGIVWTVITPDGGSIDANGVYTAPAINGNYLIRFAAAADLTQFDYVYAVVGPRASAPVTGTISISPPLGANGAPLTVLQVGTTYRFGYALTLQNSTDTSVTWSVTNGASIGTNGTFIAPRPGTYTVTVTSVASGQAASATLSAQ